jgi:hypothetical protein
MRKEHLIPTLVFSEKSWRLLEDAHMRERRELGLPSESKAFGLI